MLRVHVFSCRKVEGVSAKSQRPYQFFVLNCAITGDDGQTVAGDLVVNDEVKPGVYSATVRGEKRGERVELVLATLTPQAARAAA